MSTRYQMSTWYQTESFGTEYLSIDCANRTLGVAHVFVYNKLDIVRRSLTAMRNIIDSLQTDDKTIPLQLINRLVSQFNPMIFLRLEKVDLLGNLIKSFTTMQRIDTIIAYLDSIPVRNPIVLVEEQPKFNTTSPLVQVAVITWARMRKFHVVEMGYNLKNTPTWCGTVKCIRLEMEINAGRKSKGISYHARKEHSVRNFKYLAKKYNWRVPTGKLDDISDAVMQVVVFIGLDLNQNKGCQI